MSHEHKTSELHVTWAQQCAASILGVTATRAQITRRAIAAYVAALENLLAMPHNAPQREGERMRLRSAAKETTTTLPQGYVTEAPVRPLDVLVREYRATLPTVQDTMRADIERWRAGDTHFWPPRTR